MRLNLDPATTGPADATQAGSVAGSGSPAGVQGQSNAGSSDSIKISGPSAALSQLSSQRATRLQSLSAAVGSGAYQVSSSAISGAIVAQAVSK